MYHVMALMWGQYRWFLFIKTQAEIDCGSILLFTILRPAALPDICDSCYPMS